MTWSNCASAYAMRPFSENVCLLNGSPTLVMPRSVLRRGELGGPQLRDRRRDRGLALGRVEPLALGRGEHEVQDAALLGGELGLDQVGRALRVGARDLELVLEAAADGHDEHDERGDDAEPRDDNAPCVVRTGAHPAGQCAGRKSLVCSETLGSRFAPVLRHAPLTSRRVSRTP